MNHLPVCMYGENCLYFVLLHATFAHLSINSFLSKQKGSIRLNLTEKRSLSLQKNNKIIPNLDVTKVQRRRIIY